MVLMNLFQSDAVLSLERLELQICGVGHKTRTGSKLLPAMSCFQELNWVGGS